MARDYIESLEFRISGLADDAFEVFRMEGREAISQLFNFEVDLVADDPELAIESLPGKAATLEIIHRDEVRPMHGIVGGFRQGAVTERGRYLYHATLVPRLSLLDLSRQNQIHGTSGQVNVVDVIRNEITADSLRGPGAAVSGRLGASDLEMRIAQVYPQRDYLAQYQESDFDFISRLAEEYGIFYFFEHHSGRDVVVFGDSRTAFAPADGNADLTYKRVSGLLAGEANIVSDFAYSADPLPYKVVLRDYNYRLPHISLTAEAEIDPNGHGVVVEHGDHFRTPEEGATLARVRAEEIRAHGQRYRGTSNCLWLSAGHQFTLSDHFRMSYNTRYLVIAITHSATRAVDGIADVTGGRLESSYTNAFEALPHMVEFRPKRLTPRPMMGGLYNATIDAEGTGSRAEIDDQGRYKIRQNFDLRDEADGKASMYVRKAEPYGGANEGMHFPLLKGTEVVVACVNGDPDRPIILGAVPNPRNQSVITATEQTSNRIRTTSGSMIQIDDGTPTNGGGSGAGGGAASPVLEPQRVLDQPSVALDAPRPQANSLSDASRIMLKTTGSSSSSTADDNYLRMGTVVSPTATGYDGYDDSTTALTKADGIFLYTPGDQNSLVKGGSYRKTYSTLRDVSDNATHIAKSKFGVKSKRVGISATSSEPSDTDTVGDSSIGEEKSVSWNDGDIQIESAGDLVQNIGGSLNTSVKGQNYTTIEGTAVALNLGKSTVEVFIGHKTSTMIGWENSFSLAGKLSLFIGPSLSISAALALEIKSGINLEAVFGYKITLRTGVTEINQLKTDFNSLRAKAGAMMVDAISLLAESSAMHVGSIGLTASTQTLQTTVNGLKVDI
jgi:type VI secretion system VgrG family protein